MNIEREKPTSFIEYLLESKQKSLNRVDEAYRTPPRASLHHGVRLKLSVLKAALESRAFSNDSQVKLVNVATRQTMSCRNEFGWQPGQSIASIHAKPIDDAHPTLVSNLLNDITAIHDAGGVLDNITVRVENFSINTNSNHDDLLLGWLDNQRQNDLWIGVETSESDLQQFVVGGARFNTPPQEEAAPARQQDGGHPEAADEDPEGDGGENAAQEQASLQEIHGVKFSAEAVASSSAVTLAQKLPVFVGKWSYDEFRTTFSQLPTSIVQHFKPSTKNPANYMQADWDDGVDSFVKRLGVMLYLPSNSIGKCDVVMQLAFNGHPTVVKFTKVPLFYLETMRTKCSNWYKKIVSMYQDAYKNSRYGIQVLSDPDKFFRKNSKYLIQQDPPFTIGLAYQGEANATPQARPAGAPANQEQAHRQPRGAAAAEVALQSQLADMMKQRDLAMVQTAFGVPSAKNGMRKIFGADQGYKMLVNFPGVDKETKFVGDEAVAFLQKYNIWDGMYKDLYDTARAAHNDLQLVVKFDGDLV